MIVKTNCAEYEIFKYLSLIVPRNYSEKISEIFKPSEGILEKNKAELKRPVTIEEAKARMADIRNLTMGVTHNCNLRCHYCSFSGKYSYTRQHSSNSMDIKTYKKAIDFYLSFANSPFKVSRSFNLLSFYGGEPILEFNNILKAFDYAKKKNSENPIQRELKGVITTNGVLLNPDRVNVLIENDFIIDISLDGPKEQHDKFRVKADQTGTFNDILSNITYIRNRFPVKYDSNVRFQITIHPFHDLTMIEEFFLSYEDLFNKRNVLLSMVDLDSLEPEFKQDWTSGYLNILKQIDNSLDRDKWFYKKLIRFNFENYFTDPTRNLANYLNFTGTCFPGIDKLFVDVDGSIHICEKMTTHFAIGNVYTGFDYEAIVKIVNNWRKNIVSQKCWDCSVWWLCRSCYAIRVKGKSINFDENDCRGVLNYNKQDIHDLLNILEREDEIKNNNRYSDINSYLESL